MLDFDLLKTFVAVAERGGFTRAARALHRTQSAVSMQVKRLEDATGMPLFLRSGPAVRLTAEGEVLLGYARRLLALGEEALGATQAHGRSIAGPVRIGCIDDYASRVLPPLLAGFWRMHPGVMIEVHTGLTVHLIERLGIDFDLVLGMYAQGDTGTGEVIRQDEAIWAAAPRSDAIAAAADREDPVPLALYPEGCLFRRWAMGTLDAAGRPWRCAYMSPSLGAVEAAVEAGLAVSIFKDSTVSWRLRRLSSADGFPDLPPVVIALHTAPAAPRSALRLAEHLAAALNTPPEEELPPRRVAAG